MDRTGVLRRPAARPGRIDLNAEFYATESSALFLHPTFGTGAELAQTGKNGPSIFPTSSLALRARLAQEPWYFQAAAFDGVPGDPDNPRGTHVRFRAGDGALLIAEAGRSLAEGGLPGKISLGAWRYTVRADDLLDTDAQGNPVKRRDAGVYLLFDYPAARWSEARGVNVFWRGGIANADVNQFRRAANFGITVRGPVASRPRDAFGIGVAAERNSDKFRQAMRLAGQPAPSSELSVEVSYRAVVTDWLAIQPSVQFLRNHGDPALASASVVGVRFEFEGRGPERQVTTEDTKDTRKKQIRLVSLVCLVVRKISPERNALRSPCYRRGCRPFGESAQRCAASSSLLRASTQRVPVGVTSFFQNGACVLR